MTTTTYLSALPELLPYLAVAPLDILATQQMRNAFNEFCSRSRIWQVVPDPQTVVSGQAVYDLEPPPGADVSSIISVMLDGRTVTPRSTQQLDADMQGWRTATGTPKYFAALDFGNITLVPIPDAQSTAGLAMTLALQPALTATGMPTWIWSRYREYIVAGAVARLAGMPNKDFSNPSVVSYFRAMFDTGISVATEDATKGLSNAVIRTTSYH